MSQGSQAPLSIDEIKALASGAWRGPDATWWEREAALALDRSLVQFIPTRNGRDLYLARFWMVKPTRRATEPADGSPFESGNSVLLHYFARPDDDHAMHDHPWSEFRTTVLSGGYREASPSTLWTERHGRGWTEAPGPSVHPGPDARLRWVNVGESLHHLGEDLHSVIEVEPNTWTLVRTGETIRAWGFHPPGQAWMHYRTFLAGTNKPASIQ